MTTNAKEMRPGITLATKVTIMRILGVPFFVLLLIYYKIRIANDLPSDGMRIAALVLFIVIAATDALDGYLARVRNEITRLGAILDPIADKALMLASFILLTRPSLEELSPQFPVWFTLLAISRDAILVLGALLINAIHAHVQVRPTLAGKASTAMMMISIVMVLSKFSQNSVNAFLVATGLLVLTSGIQYIADGIRQLEHGYHRVGER